MYTDKNPIQHVLSIGAVGQKCAIDKIRPVVQSNTRVVSQALFDCSSSVFCSRVFAAVCSRRPGVAYAVFFSVFFCACSTQARLLKFEAQRPSATV